LFENVREPYAANWKGMYEYTSQLKLCHTTLFHNHTLVMI